MSEIVLSSDSEEQKPLLKVEPNREPLDCDELPSSPPVRNLQSVFDTLDYLISQDGYLCASCPVHRRRPFRDMRDLRRHMIGHVNGGRSSSTSEILCAHCGVSFGTVLLLRKHLIEELEREYGGPSSGGDPACLGNDFDDSEDEEEVINYVVKGGTLTCSVCDAEFGPVTRWNKEKFKMHVGKEHWKPATHRCEECGKRFSEETRLEKHMKKHALVMSVGWMGTGPTSTTNDVEINAEDALKDPVDIQDELLPQPEVTIKIEPEEDDQPSAIIIQPAASSESSGSESSSSEDDNTDKPVFTNKKKQAKAERIARKEALLKTAVRKISAGTDGGPIILACNLCNEGFLKQDLLDRHMASKHDDRDRPFRCKKCPKTYMSNANLQEHVRMVHEGVKFTCEQCNIKLASKSSWKRHMRGHSENGHCCDICKEKFSSHSVLVSHKRRVHENLTKNYVCVDCGNTYDNTSALRDHRITHTSERKFECPTCGMKFKRNHNLMSHQKIHLTDRPVVTLKCQECGEEFTTKGALAAHKSSHGRITCRICEQTFNDQAELMKHRREDHNITKRDPGVTCRNCHKRFADQAEMLDHRAEAHPMVNPTECEICKSVFGSAAGLRSHMRGHAPKARTHDCPNCDESFNCALMLQTHIKDDHPDVQNHVCDQCGRGYPTRKQLLAHLGRHRNPNRDRESHTGQYMCHICGKEFRLRVSLKRHVFNNHTSKRDFKCEVCNKQLVSAEGLKLHMKSHDDEQQIMCDICGKGFSQPYRLRAHMLLHEREHVEERCPTCNRAFRDKKKFELHLKSHSGETEFCCTPCQRYFATNKLLQKHNVRIHQSSTPCPVCAKVFPTDKKMKNHIRIHDNPTFFECPTCFACIKEKKHFESHMRVHAQSGVRFSCRFCPLTFTLAKSCRTHERRFHADQVGQEGASGEKPARKKKKTVQKQEEDKEGEFLPDGMMDDPLGMMDFAAMDQREDDVSVG